MQKLKEGSASVKAKLKPVQRSASELLQLAKRSQKNIENLASGCQPSEMSELTDATAVSSLRRKAEEDNEKLGKRLIIAYLQHLQSQSGDESRTLTGSDFEAIIGSRQVPPKPSAWAILNELRKEKTKDEIEALFDEIFSVSVTGVSKYLGRDLLNKLCPEEVNEWATVTFKPLV